MSYNAENPCTGDAGALEMVQLGGSNTSENNQIARKLQVLRLTRRCAISAAVAAALAPLVYGER